MATATDTTADLFRELVDALNERDWDRFAATHADDVVLHDHDETIEGIEGVIAHERALYEAFPDMRYEIESIVTDGPTIAARWRVVATHENEFEGLPPTGEKVDVPAQGMLTVEEGEIDEVWLVYDQLGLMQQLGAVDAA